MKREEIISKISSIKTSNKLEEEEKRTAIKKANSFFESYDLIKNISDSKKIKNITKNTLSENSINENDLDLKKQNIEICKQSILKFIEEVDTLSKKIIKFNEKNEGIIQQTKKEIYKIYYFSEEYFSNNEKVSLNISKILNIIPKIEKNISLISETTIDTEILSLNASINSSKVEELGDSFNVISENIKNVSEEISKSTKKGEQQIRDIEKLYKEIKDITANSLEIENKIKESLDEFQSTFLKVEEKINKITTENNKIINKVIKAKEAIL